jgi:hypothetical protein
LAFYKWLQGTARGIGESSGIERLTDVPEFRWVRHLEKASLECREVVGGFSEVLLRQIPTRIILIAWARNRERLGSGCSGPSRSRRPHFEACRKAKNAAETAPAIIASDFSLDKETPLRCLCKI